MRRFLEFTVILLFAAVAALAQQVGPIHPAPSGSSTLEQIPLHPKVKPPPIPTQQIIQHFAANDAKYEAAFKKFGYLQTIYVEELDGQNGGPTGTYGVKVELFLKPDGKRFERLLGKTTSTLQYLHLSSLDLEVIAEMPFFPLAGSAASHYNFHYRGTQKLDKLTTYVFRVEPKKVVAGQPSFSGLIWVDTKDLAIVKSYGQFVNGRHRSAGALPFTYFDTYRANIDGKYWFPVFIRSNDHIQVSGNEIPIRLIVRSTDFHPGKPVLPAPSTSH